jgi:hypothetical protein
MFYSAGMLATTARALTIWMSDDIPVRMIYGRRRWRVSDTPTPLDGGAREPAGWRFQATDDDGSSFVFDVLREDGHWHVHRVYS